MDRLLQRRAASQRDLVFNTGRCLGQQNGNTACGTQRKIAYCMYQQTGLLAKSRRQCLNHLICLRQKPQVQLGQYIQRFQGEIINTPQLAAGIFYSELSLSEPFVYIFILLFS
jgi:hypothetical protein